MTCTTPAPTPNTSTTTMATMAPSTPPRRPLQTIHMIDLLSSSLLQPMSYVSASYRNPAQPRSQGVIRASTVKLSTTVMPHLPASDSPPPFRLPPSHGLHSPLSSLTAHATQGPAEPSSELRFKMVPQKLFPGSRLTTLLNTHISSLPRLFHPSPNTNRGSPRFSLVSEPDMDPDEDLSASTYTFDSSPTDPSASAITGSGVLTPRGLGHTTLGPPSALSILLAHKQEHKGSEELLGRERASALEYPTSQTSVTPTNERQGDAYFSSVAANAPHDHPTASGEEVEPELPDQSQPIPDEATSLLRANRATVRHEDANNSSIFVVTNKQPQHTRPVTASDYGAIVSLPKPCETLRSVLDPNLGRKAFRAIPAVVLGTLLNVLDGISYGMIIFPAAGLFANFGGAGVSMFFMSTVVAQLVYALGGSNFAGANGSMMIEVVPFFHIIASTIARDIIGDDWAGMDDMNREVIATTLVAFALSSLLTGFTFFLLGYLRLGVLIGFFPRHILVGCIGGVGIFLILTGLTVSTHIPSDALNPPTWEILRYFALDPHALAMWVPPLMLAVLLRVITARWKHQLLFPIYFLVIPIIFYIVVAAAQLDLDTLRWNGWLFESAQKAEGMDSWYTFYTYYDWRAVRWNLIWTTLPTQFALLFFNVLHPPLNVPALAVSLDEEVDTDKELVAHGMSNFAAGFLGTVYVLTYRALRFYRVGGGNRVAGFMLAVATFLLLIIGTWPIAYIPVMVVGALIFVLGLDLVKEALWDTRHRVSRMEYITITSIMIAMTAWDFVIGVLFGIVVSCFFFVIQNSQHRSIRTCYTGDTAVSTVRRPAAHRAYIHEVSKQTRIIQLQGFLFFGTISHVEDTIRSLVNDPTFHAHPVRFVVVDFSLVAGVDLSAAEAFVRIQRLLALKGVVLVFCGVSREEVGQALGSVGVLEQPYVELFETLNDAMEWTENAYLRAWFRAQKKETTPVGKSPVQRVCLYLPTRLNVVLSWPVLPGRQKVDVDFHETLVGSPRRLQLKDAGERIIASGNLSVCLLYFHRIHFRASYPELFTDVSAEPLHTLLRAFGSFDALDRASLSALAPYFEYVAFPAGAILWEKEDPPNGLYIIQSGVLRASYRFAEHTPIIEGEHGVGDRRGRAVRALGAPAERAGRRRARCGVVEACCGEHEEARGGTSTSGTVVREDGA
ncbi:sulfate transporter family-domain-containing protein [Lanmaoa asiatica]|nr:sulfate transporter family-domain-containing protein [Lanmaoa asiatica]